MKKTYWFISFLLFSHAALAATTNAEYHVCKQPYALCTTAPCKPIPGSKNQSLCSCVVQDGLSVGKTSCDKRRAIKTIDGRLQIVSTFSLHNYQINKIMTCPGMHAWTNCLDKPCLVDPQNSNQATCTCNILASENFVTFGGSCDTASCATVLYSGATKDESQQGIKVLLEAMHLSQSPMASCEVTT